MGPVLFFFFVVVAAIGVITGSWWTFIVGAVGAVVFWFLEGTQIRK